LIVEAKLSSFNFPRYTVIHSQQIYFMNTPQPEFGKMAAPYEFEIFSLKNAEHREFVIEFREEML